MSTKDKLKLLYKECQNIEMDDSMDLILESTTQEEKEFYVLVGDLILQQRQKKAIEENIF